ncbi:MAG: bacteriohopanetetrol glucosamine biosynthesis glycosyltransferase HpnI [Steroidobacteraceae bacterium]
MPLFHEFVAAAGLICVLLSCAYALLAVLAVVMRRLETPHQPHSAGPPATILKPLCGMEPGLYTNLRSFCEQDYSQFQIVFGVRDSSDPALAVVDRLRAEFPNLRIDVAVNAQQHGSNRKVSNLINMLEYARHDVLVIADSDALVCPRYLSTITAPLQDESTGLVTCLYHSVPAPTRWSRLGAMYINEWYMPSVLLARLFGQREFASGQTLCLRRDTLNAIGGLRSIANHLADDYQLGALIRGLGKRIVLSSYVTTAEQYDPSPEALVQHETRWMRTIRVLRPHSFRFLFITFSVPLAVLGLLMTAGHERLSQGALVLLLVSVNARLLLHRLAKRTGDPAGRGGLWLLPLRDLLVCWVWLRAFRSSPVIWRGAEFEVDVHGVMRSGG